MGISSITTTKHEGFHLHCSVCCTCCCPWIQACSLSRPCCPPCPHLPCRPCPPCPHLPCRPCCSPCPHLPCCPCCPPCCPCCPPCRPCCPPCPCSPCCFLQRA